MNFKAQVFKKIEISKFCFFSCMENINCKGCYNLKACENCMYSYNLKACENCYGCKNCEKCSDSRNLFESKDCKKCSKSYDLTNCEKVDSSYNCDDSVNCSEAYGLHHCNNCKYVENSYHCYNLKGTYEHPIHNRFFNLTINEEGKQPKPVQPCLMIPRGIGRLDHLSSLLAVVRKTVHEVLDNLD